LVSGKAGFAKGGRGVGPDSVLSRSLSSLETGVEEASFKA